MSSLFITPFSRPLGLDGRILPLGKLYFFYTGTLNEAPVYDEDGDVLSQPVSADITGVFPNVYLDETITYRVQLKSFLGVLQGDADPASGLASFDISYLPSGTGAVSRTVQDKLRESVSLADFRAAGATDDNAALALAKAACIAAGGMKLHLPAGKGSGTGGKWLISSTTSNLCSNLHIIGDGIGKTIVEASPAHQSSPIFYADSGSAVVANNLVNIEIEGIEFHGNVATLGFLEGTNLLQMQGVTGLHIHNCKGVGPRCDFLTLECKLTAGVARHNVDVSVHHIWLDGVNNNNRNGFSINDCDGGSFTDIFAENYTRTGDGTTADPDGSMVSTYGLGMPGLFDFEPAADTMSPEDFFILRRISVARVFGYNIGGINGAITLNLRPQDTLATPQRGFSFTDIFLRDCPHAIDCSGYTADAALTQTQPYEVSFEGGLITGATQYVARFAGMLGVRFAIPAVDCAGHVNLGYSGDTRANADITIDCDMRRIGTLTGIGIQVQGSTRNVRIQRGNFSDVGKADGTGGTVLVHTSGTAHELIFTHNRIESPAAKTTQIAARAGGTVTSADCQNHSNIISGFTPGVADSLNPLGIEDGWVVVAAGTGGSVADGAVTSWAVTVTGARMGDIPSVVINSAVPGLHLLSARMFADDTVQAILLNKSGFSIDTTAYTFTTQVIKKPGR